MSGDQQESREALTLNKVKHMSKKNLEELASSGIDAVKEATDQIRDEFDKKCQSMGVDNPLKPEAPAIIKERSKSEPPKPPESGDIEYLSYKEVIIGDEINTLRYKLVEDPDAGDSAEAFIERCVGRNPESHKLIVMRIPAKKIPIKPSQVMRYLGNVVQDLNSVHTGNIVFQRRRPGYVFDRFFYFNGKKLTRCCLVENRIHQAGLMYEKYVHRKTRRAMARIRRLPGGDAPMYEVVGAKEGDYRDLKRLYERHFLRRSDRLEETDPAFMKLIEGSMPLIPTE